MKNSYTPETLATAIEPKANFRWVIVALLFFATTVNYLDRAVISLLKECSTGQTGNILSTSIISRSTSRSTGLKWR